MGVQWVSKQRGERHHAAQLTERKVRAMRRMHYEKGVCMCCVARLFGTSKQTAFDAISYITWAHVK